ncbi:hypothetical protein Gotur_009164 [Gossypium turneri]
MWSTSLGVCLHIFFWYQFASEMFSFYVKQNRSIFHCGKLILHIYLQ